MPGAPPPPISVGGHAGGIPATEAAVDDLIAEGAHRLEAAVATDDVAGMRALEELGFTFECRARDARATAAGWADEIRYALTAAERAAWRARRSAAPAAVDLVEITPEDAHLWGRLATHHSEERFVAPMARSFRDALFPEVVDGAPVVPWMRGVLADGERAGFVMLAEVTAHHPDPYLWRLLVDRMHQRRGIGARVVGLVCERLSAEGHGCLLTSWVEGAGSPRPFYEGLGFVPTGRLVDGETEARLNLA